MDEKKLITPKSRVLDVIEQYPRLEKLLIEYVPAFEKLKNPMLRRTVGRVATLQQAAAIGQVKVEDLINHLRSEVGQDLVSESHAGDYNTDQPKWFSADKIGPRLDASAMLAGGNHPVNQVLADLKNMDSSRIYALKAPFLPAPLIDKALSLGFKHWVVKEDNDSYMIYFGMD